MSVVLEDIIRVSEELFMQYGIKSITMDDIASKMSISKKTLYKFVSDKRDLVEKAVDYMFFKNRFHEKCMSEDLNAIEQYTYIHKHVMNIISTTNFSTEYDLKKYYPDIYEQGVEKRNKMMIKGIQMNLEKGIREGLYRPEIDAEVIAKLNVMMKNSMHDYDFLHENKTRFLHIMNVNFDYFIHGVCSPKGLKEYYKLKDKQENNEE